MNRIWIQALSGLVHLGLKTDPLCPTIYHYVKAALFLYQRSRWPLYLSFLVFSGSKKKEPRCACLSEAKASHSHKMWTEVPPSVPHSLQVRLSLSHITYKCLLKLLCPIRRPITTLDCVPLTNNNQALVLSPVL
jgi:hypothetical protein